MAPEALSPLEVVNLSDVVKSPYFGDVDQLFPHPPWNALKNDGSFEQGNVTGVATR